MVTNSGGEGGGDGICDEGNDNRFVCKNMQRIGGDGERGIARGMTVFDQKRILTFSADSLIDQI
jgi:hypothetical protein